MHNFRKNLMLVGAGGPGALQTSSPARSLGRVDTDPHAALRALLVGLRPPTPQSPERLRSTPFDCVAIAPCCFAFRKAVLSHALAALTALNKSASQVEREAIAALTALKAREKTEPLRELAALTALNKSAGQAVETLPNGGEHHSPGETASSAVAEETTPRLRKAVGVSPVYRRNTVEK